MHKCCARYYVVGSPTDSLVCFSVASLLVEREWRQRLKRIYTSTHTHVISMHLLLLNSRGIWLPKGRWENSFPFFCVRLSSLVRISRMFLRMRWHVLPIKQKTPHHANVSLTSVPLYSRNPWLVNKSSQKLLLLRQSFSLSLDGWWICANIYCYTLCRPYIHLYVCIEIGAS
jgi:hypothetical protein